MSERPPPGWDTQGTPDARSATPPPPAGQDEVLAAHLVRRGAHQPPRTLAVGIARDVAQTDPERRWRLTLAAWRPRVAVAVSGVALVLVAGLLFYGPSRTGTDQGSPTPPASPTQPGATSQPVVGVTWDPTQRALPPPELLRILATNPAPGTVLIVDDQIVPYPVSCTSGPHCPAGQLQNGRGVLVEAPPGGYLTYTQDPGTSDYSVSGPLALQVGSGPNLVFLGAMVSNGQRLSFTARDLSRRNAMGGLFVIPAWLWSTPPAPCPWVPGTPVPMPTSELGLPAPRLACVATDWLTDSASTNPERGGGVGFAVQHGAFGTFAVDPTTSAPSQRNPTQGVYLVRDWAGYGEILARLEPVVVPPPESNGSASAAPSQPSQDLVLSAAELVDRVVGGTLARGFIVVATIPATAVSDVPAPSGTKACAPTCPAWLVSAGGRSITVSLSAQGPILRSIVGTQAFLVVGGGAVQALGPAATGAGGAPLDGMTIGDGLSVVAGWLRIGPPLPCPKGPAPVYTGLLGEPLGWSQCPGTWILPSDNDPWAGPPNNVQASDGSGSIQIGDTSVPDGTLHVQDGAGDADLQPREGVWLVRNAVTNACPPWAQCPAPSDGVAPRPHVTWYELVGPVVASEASAAGPSPVPSPDPASPGNGSVQDGSIVLSQAQLVAAVTSGTVPAGSILIAQATIAPVILASLPPDQNTIVGKIGPLRIHWASDPILGLRDPHPVVVRVRTDGELDYLGPATLDAGRPFASSAVPYAQGLLLVHGWFYRPTFNLRCLDPIESGAPQAFRTFDGRIQNLACDAAWVLPSAADPYKIVGNGATLEIPSGSLSLQIRDGARGAPTEGLYLVRFIACLWHGGRDVCEKPAYDAWEFVGPVVVPGP